MTRRAALLSLLLAVGIVVGFGLAIGSYFEDRPPRQQDEVTVVSATGQTVDSASGVPRSVRRAPSIRNSVVATSHMVTPAIVPGKAWRHGIACSAAGV